MKDKRDIILEFHSSPDAILNALHQAGWQVTPKTHPQRSELENHDCKYDSDGAPCNHCGRTAAEAITYFERNLNKSQCSEQQTREVGLDRPPAMVLEIPVSEQQEWTRGRERGRQQIMQGDRLVVDIGYDEAIHDQLDTIIEVHNAAITAERQRREQAEGVLHHMEACRSLLKASDDDVLYEAIDDMQVQLLSAQAAIEKITKIRPRHDLGAGIYLNDALEIAKSVNLSLLHKHDAEVRKPMVDCLNDIKVGAPDIVRKQIDDALAKVKST